MKLYKFRSTDNFIYLADMLVSQRLYCPTLAELNDPMEGYFSATRVNSFKDGNDDIQITTSGLEDIKHEADIRVCCFSSNIESIKMWAHYGGSHKGIALEYNLEGFYEEIVEVKYDSSFFDYKTLDNEKPNARDVLSVKTVDWKYESEYRILTSKKFLPLDGRLERVILGRSFPRNIELILRRLAPDNCKFSRVGLDPSRACLGVYDIIDTNQGE